MMPLARQLITLLLLTCSLNISVAAIPKAGFSIPDSLREVTLHYKGIRNLIVLPFTINDSVNVNLILDTGCRNLVLFGNRFNKFFELHPEKKIQFSGLGSGNAVSGRLSLNNKVSMEAVIGERIPVIIIPDQNLFHSYSHVDGIIGYDLFIKFEVELNCARRLITFRPAYEANISPEYEKIEIKIEDGRPIMTSMVFLHHQGINCDVMIDTGSSLSLLLKTTDLKKYQVTGTNRILGRGLNGPIEGTQTIADKLLLDHLEIKKVPTGIIYSPWHNHASVGMELIGNYSMVLNYCKSYVGFKKA